MAKRFIDTGFLDQKWIRKLSPEKKIFIIYLMLKCDNAGVIDLDMEDAEFWIGKKMPDPQTFLPENFLIPVNGGKYFIPKFLKWQYPNFPHSKVHQQKQAINILTELQIFDTQTNNLSDIYLNLTQSLPNSQVIVNVNDSVSDNGNAKELVHKVFYKAEFEKTKGNPLQHKYYFIIKYIYNIEENVIGEEGLHILKLKKQLTFEQFIKLHEYCSKRATTIKEMIDSWLNKPSYSTGRISVYAVLQKWAQKSPISGTNFKEDKTELIETNIGKG